MPMKQSKMVVALMVRIGSKIYKKEKWTEEEKRWAFWVLNSPQRIACVLGKRKPPASTFHLTKERQEAILFRLRKDLQKVIGRLLRVREARSILYDEEMYWTYEMVLAIPGPPSPKLRRKERT
ncbi:hypothetical protein A7K93_02175 [Candidatus Methylacidiphilum fumarolicum]|nr:hypothetical protein A7K93_02175 [Candidatus Methylacidiphilum fumarolicum]